MNASSASESFRAGMVAVIGRPNVGKSSLVNALVGYKVSIVAPKAQTTRHRILGVSSDEAGQIVFIDTPGLHDGSGRALNRYLNRAARGSLDEAHVVVLVVEAMRWTGEDEHVLEIARASEKPVMLVLNKVDKVGDKRVLLPLLAQHANRHVFAAMVPVSAQRGVGLDDLRRTLLAALPVGEPLFEIDAITNRSERFLVAELVREQVVLQLHEELPYATTVEVEHWQREGALLHVIATIWVERDGQKGIVIGAGGERIKAIGTAARAGIEQQFETRVHLELHVRVREHWSDDEAALRRFGYGD